eukprot:SAG31_NODE_2001_length_6694_cov_7.781198_1_plen_1195_part_10
MEADAAKAAVDDLTVLLVSEDMGAITAALSKYAEMSASSSVVEAQWNAVMEHREELVSSGREALQELLESQEVPLIDEGLSRYAGYGDDVETEVAALREHRASLVERAEMEADAAKAAVDDLTVLLVSEDMGAITAALSKYAERSAQVQQVRSQWRAVNEHRKQLLHDSQHKLAALMCASDLDSIDIALEAYKFYGPEVDVKLAALKDHRAKLLDRQTHATVTIEKLLVSEDMGAITAALSKYAEMSAVEAQWNALYKRREDLVGAARQALQELLESQEVPLIDEGLSRYAGYGDDVETEVAALRSHRLVLSSSRDSLRSCEADISHMMRCSDLHDVSNFLSIPSNFPAQLCHLYDELVQHRDDIVARHRQQLLELHHSKHLVQIDSALAECLKFASLFENEYSSLKKYRSDLIREQDVQQKEVSAALVSNDIQHISSVLSKHADVLDLPHMQIVGAALKCRREQILATAKERLVQACKLTDLQEIGSVIKSNEMMPGVEMELHAAQTHRQQLLQAAESAMSSALTSSDYSLVTSLISKHEEVPIEAQQALGELREHRMELLRAAQICLQELLDSEDVNAMDVALEKYSSYGVEIFRDMRLLRNRRTHCVNIILSKFTSMLEASSLRDVTSLLQEHKNVPPECRAARDSLERRAAVLQQNISKVLSTALSSTDIQHLRQLVGTYESVGSHLQSWKQLQDHVNNLCREAQTELMAVASDPNACYGAVSTAYKRYEAYGEAGSGIDALLQLLRSKIESYTTAARTDIFNALDTTSLGSDRFLNVENVLQKYIHHPKELDEKYQALKCHRDALVRVAQAVFMELCQSYDLDEVSQALKDHAAFSEVASAEWNALLLHEQRLADFVESSIDEILSMMDCDDIRQVAMVLSKYAEHPVQAREHHQELQIHQSSLLETVRANLRRLCYSGSVPEIEEALSECESFADLVSVELTVLRERREIEIASAKSQIGALLVSHDYSAISEGLDKFSPFSGYLAPAYDHLRDYRIELLRSVQEELKEALESDQVHEIDSVLRKNESYQHEPAWQTLEAHRQTVLSAVQTMLTDLLNSHEVDDIDVALRKHQGYPIGIEAEVEALKVRRTTICEAASQVIDAILETGDYSSICGIISEFETCPADVSRQQWTALSQRKAELLAKAREHLLTICDSCEVSELEEVSTIYNNASTPQQYTAPQSNPSTD